MAIKPLAPVPNYYSTLVFDNTAGSGIKVNGNGPDYGWRDVEGLIYPDPANPSTSPTVSAFRGNVYGYAYSNGDICHFSFHIPHDYAPGTHIYLHTHWAHNATNVAANTLTFAYELTYAKGHNQEVFPAPITPSITYALTNIATTPQYRHNITEIQLSATSPSATQIDSDNLEVDGIIIGAMTMGIPANSFTGGSPDEAVYIFTMDLHYQTTNIGTKNRVPNFYT